MSRNCREVPPFVDNPLFNGNHDMQNIGEIELVRNKLGSVHKQRNVVGYATTTPLSNRENRETVVNLSLATDPECTSNSNQGIIRIKEELARLAKSQVEGNK